LSPSTHRLLSRASIAGGLCWILLAVFGLATSARPDGERLVLDGAADYAAFGSFAAALALTVAALAALHLHHRGVDGRLGRAGTIVACAGAAAQFVVIATIVATGEEPSWFGVAAPVAIFTWFAGSVLLGIAIRRAAVVPRWVGTVLPIVTAFAIVGSEAGTSVLIGAFLIAVGTRLARAAGDHHSPAFAGAH
jgi:hypothetical protein